MKKLSKLLLAVLAVVCLSVVFTSCFLFPDDKTTTTTNPNSDPPADPVIESISVSGQKTDFFTGDEFATGDLLVTLHYDDETSTAATADQYTVDSSAFVKETAGEYEITVALKDSDIKTSYTVTVVDPVATSISLTSQKTVFLTGDEFSVGEMVVTLHYNNGSTSVVSADQYTVDSSAFNKDAAGEYKITVSLNGTEFSAEYTVAVDTRYYDVTLPDGIILNTGVENGKTTVNATITFTADAPAEGKHNVVKVNGTAITPVDGVYSVKASDYLTTLDATITVTIEQEAHAFGEWVENEGGDSRTRTCACGASETENKISVTLKLNNGEADKTVKLYAGEKLTALEAPVKAGYTFKSWQFDGADFDFDTAITAPITLYATYNESTYSVEIYEQGVDGEYTLVDTLTKIGTTGTTATVDGSIYTCNELLVFDAEHADNELSGTIEGDSSLVLKVYYSFKKVTVYSLDGLNCASIVVTFDEVEDGTLALLEMRNENNEPVERIYAAVTSNVATFDVAGKALAGNYAAISVDGAAPSIVSVVTKNNIVASANVSEEMYNDEDGTIELSNGITINGIKGSSLVPGGGMSTGTNTVYVSYANEFDKVVVSLSTLSFCGSGGTDKIFVQNGSGTGLGSLQASSYSVIATKDFEFTYSQAPSLKFISYVYCTGWLGCLSRTSNTYDLPVHETEWNKIDKVVFYKDITLSETSILNINGNDAAYTEASIVTVYESGFYGELKDINIAIDDADVTDIQVIIYQNGEKIGETLSASVISNVATIDASGLKLANTTVQIEVIGAIPTAVTLNTVDSVDLGVELHNGFGSQYEGGIGVSCAITNGYEKIFDEQGRFYCVERISDKHYLTLNLANIYDNLVSLNVDFEISSCCQDGGVDGVWFKNSANNKDYYAVAINNTTGEGTTVQQYNTGDILKSTLSENLVCIRFRLGCSLTTSSSADLSHYLEEYIDMGVVSANLSYTAEAVTLYK